MSEEHKYDLPSSVDESNFRVPTVNIKKDENGSWLTLYEDGDSLIVMDESQARTLAVILKSHYGWS